MKFFFVFIVFVEGTLAGGGSSSCTYYDSAGTRRTLAVGHSVVDGQFRHTCEAVPNTPGAIRYSSKVIACKFQAEIYQKGQTWESSKMLYQCFDNGSYKPIGCIPQPGLRLKIGDVSLIGDPKQVAQVHKCIQKENYVQWRQEACGQAINMACPKSTVKAPDSGNSGGGSGHTQPPSASEPCYTSDGTKTHGTKWISNYRWKKQCYNGIAKTIGCVVWENGNSMELDIGESRRSGVYQHNCVRDENDSGRVRYYKDVVACQVKDKIYQKGQTWTAGKIYYTCSDNGAFLATGCEPEHGFRMLPGEKKVTGNLPTSGKIHQCYREGDDKVSYRGQLCGTQYGITCGGSGSGSGKSCYAPTGEKRDGDTWISNNRFKKKCNNGRSNTVACYFWEHGTPKEIGIGSSRRSGVYQHNCQPDAHNPSSIRYYVKVVACQAGDKIYEKGQTFTSGKMFYKCGDEGGFETIGCEPEPGVRMYPGQSKITGNPPTSGTIHTCVKKSNGRLSHSYRSCGSNYSTPCRI